MHWVISYKYRWKDGGKRLVLTDPGVEFGPYSHDLVYMQPETLCHVLK